MALQPTTEQSQNFDLLKELYDNELDYLLERVFLNLPQESIKACKEIGKEWKGIVSEFYDKRRPGMDNVLNARISQNIKEQKCNIISSVFKSSRIALGLVYPLAMTADQRNVFIGGTDDDDDVVIQVLNAETFNRIAILQIGKNIHTHNYKIHRLHLNSEYLVASVEVSGNHERDTGNVVPMVWKRDPVIRYKFDRIPIDVDGVKIPRHLSLLIATRCYNQNILAHVQKRVEEDSTLKVTFSRWNLETGKKEEPLTLVAAADESHPVVEIIPLLKESDQGDFLSWSTNKTDPHESKTEGVLKRHSNNKIAWMRTFEPGCERKENSSFGLKNVFADHVVLELQRKIEGKDVTVLEVVDLATGSTVNIFELSAEFSGIIDYKICSGRLAVQGYISDRRKYSRSSALYAELKGADIIILDLSTGALLTRMTDLGFNQCTGNFCLERDRITFYSKYQYRSVRYWD